MDEPKEEEGDLPIQPCCCCNPLLTWSPDCCHRTRGPCPCITGTSLPHLDEAFTQPRSSQPVQFGLNSTRPGVDFGGVALVDMRILRCTRMSDDRLLGVMVVLRCLPKWSSKPLCLLGFERERGRFGMSRRWCNMMPWLLSVSLYFKLTRCKLEVVAVLRSGAVC